MMTDQLSSYDISALEPLRTDAERERAKPDISRLPNALGPDGSPLFKVGDTIIIERRSTILDGNPYLDTRTYSVTSIDMDTGTLDLFDADFCQTAMSNFRKGPNHGFIFKLPRGKAIVTKRKRGRPRKIDAVDAPVIAVGEKAAVKRRGRPPGAKNRSKAVIKAEKVLKREEATQRKARRSRRR